MRPGDYADMRAVPRPSHADFTYMVCFSIFLLFHFLSIYCFAIVEIWNSLLKWRWQILCKRDHWSSRFRYSFISFVSFFYLPKYFQNLKKTNKYKQTGAIAEKWLQDKFGVSIVAWVSGVGEVEANRALEVDASITRQVVDGNAVRCPDLAAAEKMTKVDNTSDYL